LKKLLALIAFSVLLLVPVGAQNVFANHPTILGCPPPIEGLTVDLITDPLVIPSGIGTSGPFCQHSLEDLLIPDGTCLPPYVFGDVDIVGGGYQACLVFPQQIQDLTLAAQCQGAAVLLSNHCFAEIIAMVGGALLSIDTTAVLVAAIGTDPVVTGLVALTMVGVAGQAAWLIHRRKKKN